METVYVFDHASGFDWYWRLAYWTYRVVHFTRNGSSGEPLAEQYWSLCEVYFDCGGRAVAHGEASICDWESLDELRETIAAMMSAMEKPVLEQEEIGYRWIWKEDDATQG